MRSQLLTVPLEDFLVDPAIHGRAVVKQATVREYALASGDPEGANDFPPVDAFRDSKGHLWLADGFLRYYGSRAAGHHVISTCVHSGERQDAIKFACGSNADHGLPRSRADKQATAAALLLAPEHADLSDREIGRQAGISHTFVSALRPHCSSQESYEGYQIEQGEARRRARSARREARLQAERELREQAGLVEESAPHPSPSEAPFALGFLASPRPLPSSDRPLTAREEAEQLLARAAGSMLRAKRALSAIKDVYPESIHFPAVVATAEARYAIEDLLPVELRTTPADHRHALHMLTQFGIDLDLKVGEGRDEGRVTRGEEERAPRQPETLPSRHQPETLPVRHQPETLPVERDEERGTRGEQDLPARRQPETLPPSDSSLDARSSPAPSARRDAARSPPAD